jgi:hypothetical protein
MPDVQGALNSCYDPVNKVLRLATPTNAVEQPPAITKTDTQGVVNLLIVNGALKVILVG